ncbi:hypothetical protein H0H92_000826 [Tricholoma furcatifolium]|nr:hypothetical protein H0H92_000826 [Tricholoma furcatifolium]
MKYNVTAALLSLINLAASTAISRQSCSEAERFGVLTISPTEVSAGDIAPVYLDYTIEVPEASNNGHEPNMLLARRTYDSSSTVDEFTVEIPSYTYFSGAAYEVVLTNTYYTTGTYGSSVLVQGGVSTNITIDV